MASTIYALSSGAPPAAIAIVRVSGPSARRALETLAGRCPPARRATVVTLSEQGEHLDRALTLFFPGPASATGEDLAELHLHGGRATVARVLAALSRIDGLIAAAPGQFTRRAFENGRIDLAEAEGLADLLFAETETQRRSALAMAQGKLSREVETWHERLLQLSARVEAQLDFTDEDDVPEDAALERDVAELAGDLAAALERPSAERLRDGVRVAIAGPPNAGKSTLLNALADREAAIVSSRAGTTRDVIEVPVSLEGRALVLIDMAGIRDVTHDQIEQLGIARARKRIADSEIVLWLGDNKGDVPPGALWVWPRSDEHGRAICAEADFVVSATSGEGLDLLVRAILERVSALLPREAEGAINERQRSCLVEALRNLTGFDDFLILAENLRLARFALDRLLGRNSLEDMLSTLFQRFCIGK